MARIAYFYREMSEYIEIDLCHLREEHAVTATACAARWPRPLATWRLVAGADTVMTWFASWHALVPALCAKALGRPFVIVVGGYDTACLPGIDYGHRRGGFRGLVARAVMGLASRIVILSEFTRGELRAMGADDARVVLLPLGLDPARYARQDRRERDLVITTGGINHSNLSRKGLEAFVRAAALLPDARFVVIGAWMDGAIGHLRAIATRNVSFTGRVPHADKVGWMARAAVVVQASRHEAFGLSLAEGMLCGAVPVVTDAGALPWVAGGTGVVVATQEPADVARGIARALALGPDAGAAARTRVLREFTSDLRREGLARVLDSVGIRSRGAAPARTVVDGATAAEPSTRDIAA